MVQTDSSTTNPTVFRDDVVNALKALNPGTIRMMAAGAALGSDIPNQLAVPFARYRGGFNSSATNEPDVAYGIHEFLQLCQTVGADPWITIPTATTPQEMTDFINYLTGNGGDTYSAIRIARGQAEPWTTVFNKIHIELGNETWNGDFKGESISYPAYPQWANQVFGAARGVSTYDATKFDLVLDGWASVPGYNAQMLTYSTQHDSIDIAPYLLYSANNEPQSTMFGALMAEPEMFDSVGGEVYNNVLAAQGAARKTAVNVYETNMGSMIGNITQAQLDQLTPSVGAGIATAEHMLQMMRLGVQAQNAFALPQYKFLRSDQSLARLWGIVVDMGTTNRRRPQFLTEALANSVIGGTMMQTVQTGDPTWNQPLSSDGVQLNGAHYLQSFAFSNNGTNSLILFNLSQTTALPVSFTGPNVPSGTVQMSQITSANITDNNETSNTVQTVNKTLSGFDPTATFTLPPFSMTVLTANSSVTQVPTFSIPAGTYTSAQTVALSDGTLGAKIYFTTDGSTPTTSSTLYTGPIAVSASVTVNAMAVASGLTASPMASAAYVIGAQKATATPVFSIGAGSYTVAQTVAITDATSGATIYYTTDGSVPTTSSTKYAGPITVSATATLSAIATATNYTNSGVAQAIYTITPVTQVVAAPVFSVPSGTYTTTQQVAMAAATPGSTIHYTTDGSTPTATSASYTSAITVSTTAVVQAIATKPLFKPSPVASAHYTIKAGNVTADPLFSVPAGTYSAAQEVTLSDATPKANIFYEVRTGTQHTALTKYTAPIKITESATIVAYAVAPSTTRSAEISHAYTISTSTEPETDSPVFSVKPGTYATGQTVTLSDATAGAEIFYTTNGVTPTSGSTKYSVPVKVTASMVVKAIAVAPGHTVSAEADGAYTIGSTLTPVGFQTGEMTLRGSSKLVGQTLRLTDGGESEIAAAWSAKRVSFSTFDLEFNFQLPASTADGFTLTLQNSGKGNWASGGNGAALGYQGISNSVAIKFALFDSVNKKEVSDTGLLINGVIPTTSVDMSSSGINLHTGHTYTARLTYDGTQLTQTVTDTVTHAVFTHSYKVNIAGVLGSTTAYIGFTASTGRYTSTQDILNWAFVSK
jgi:alpha-L-arabinofuranosidase